MSGLQLFHFCFRATPTIWFSLDRKRRSHTWSRKKMETLWFVRLRFRCAYDSAWLRLRCALSTEKYRRYINIYYYYYYFYYYLLLLLVLLLSLLLLLLLLLLSLLLLLLVLLCLIRALTTSLTTPTPTPSLVKTSLKPAIFKNSTLGTVLENLARFWCPKKQFTCGRKAKNHRFQKYMDTCWRRPKRNRVCYSIEMA